MILTFFNLWIFLAKNLLRRAAILLQKFCDSSAPMITEDMITDNTTRDSSTNNEVSKWLERVTSGEWWSSEGWRLIYGPRGGGGSEGGEGGRCAQRPTRGHGRGNLREEYFPRAWGSSCRCRSTSRGLRTCRVTSPPVSIHRSLVRCRMTSCLYAGGWRLGGIYEVRNRPRPRLLEFD